MSNHLHATFRHLIRLNVEFAELIATCNILRMFQQCSGFLTIYDYFRTAANIQHQKLVFKNISCILLCIQDNNILLDDMLIVKSTGLSGFQMKLFTFCFIPLISLMVCIFPCCNSVSTIGSIGNQQPPTTCVEFLSLNALHGVLKNEYLLITMLFLLHSLILLDVWNSCSN